MNAAEKKKVIRKYLRRKALFGADLREKALLEDNIDISKWAKNMDYLQTQDYLKREEVDPLIVRINEAAHCLPPILLVDRKKRNWFIAAYPDVINYFIPSADTDYSWSENAYEETEGESIFHKLGESIPEWQIVKLEADPTEFLLYLKHYYKDVLKKSLSLATSTHHDPDAMKSDQKGFDAAIGEYKEAIRLNPNDAHAHNNLGLAYHKQGKLEDAILEYREALTIDSDNGDIKRNIIKVWDNQAVTFGNTGKHRESIVLCDNILELDPRFVGAWFNKGISLENLGELDEAVKCFEKAIEIDLRFYRAWDGKGRVLARQGVYQESIDCCDRVLKINSNFKTTWNTKGLCFRAIGRMKEALDCFKRALELDQNYAEAWYNAGLLLQSLGRSKEAADSYKRFISCAPDEYAAQVRQAKDIVRQLEEDK